MAGLTAYYVVYPANLSNPTESDILAGWPGNAISSGTFPAIEGQNNYTIRDLPPLSDYKVAILVQDGVKSNIIITPFSTTSMVAYYVVYPDNLQEPSNNEIINGWPGVASFAGNFPVIEGENTKELTGLSGGNLKVSIVVVDDVISNSVSGTFLLEGLITYYVCYLSTTPDPTVAEIISGWSGTAIKAGSFNSPEGYNNLNITGLLPGTTYKVAMVSIDGPDVSNELSIVFATISGVQRRSTRMPRMLLTFPRFRRYS
jgi:hypothetical protein